MFKSTNFIVAFFFVFSLSFSFYVASSTLYSADLHAMTVDEKQDLAHEFYPNFIVAPYEIVNSSILKETPILPLSSNNNMSDLHIDQNMSSCHDIISLNGRCISPITNSFTSNHYTPAIFVITN
jgi:hypothetical protein